MSACITLSFPAPKLRGMKNVPINFNFNGIVSKSLHAEMNAISTLLKKKKKIPKTIIVVGYYKNKLHNSKPCTHCLKMLKMVGIKNVIYSTGDSDVFRKERVRNINPETSSGNR
jgi:deoxycytidylate deaminase